MSSRKLIVCLDDKQWGKRKWRDLAKISFVLNKKYYIFRLFSNKKILIYNAIIM